MSTPKFAETHNLVAFLDKPEESEGFEQTIDFLNASSINMPNMKPTLYFNALIVFLATAKAPEEVGEGSAVPTDSHHTTTHPSTSRPQKKLSRRKHRKDKIATLKERVTKLEKKRRSRTYKPRRLYKVGLSRRIASSDDAKVTLIDETQERNDEDLMFDTGVLNDEVVFQKPMVNTATTTSSILVSDADPVTTAGEVVTTASVEIPEELTLA
ncbi:hypothetical protein Tco_0580287 [Tanacetum coccineum]